MDKSKILKTLAMKDFAGGTTPKSLNRACNCEFEGDSIPEGSQSCHCEEVTAQSPAMSSQTKFRCAHSYGTCFAALNEFRCRTNRSSNSTLCRKAAFTLAETLIVLVVLGVVASITIPAVVRNQIDAQNRTKLKKCMTVYDMGISKMVVENGIKSNDALINEFNADKNNGSCAKSRAYFKSVEENANNNCIFKSSDGVWWDISDITRPKIDLKNGNFDEDSDTRFQMFAHFGKDGELRVDDIQYDIANVQTDKYIKQSDVESLNDLYNFANKETGTLFEKKCEAINDTQCKIGDTIYTKKTIAQTEVNHMGNDEENSGELCIWTKEKGQTCPYTSTAQAGDLYFTELKSWDDYKSYVDSDSSDCEECKFHGVDDYYNSAKRYCEAQGGRLPTLAELQARGYNSGYIWASEQYNSNVALVLDNGYVNGSGNDGYHDVVCVGK